MTTQTNSERLDALGVQLPSAPKPVASYLPVRIAGNVAYVSGQLPTIEGKLVETGTVPAQVSAETATNLARQCAINALAAIQQQLGSIDRVTGVIRVGVFVASSPDFGGQPAIANGASDLLAAVFGDAGRHARAAVGVASLPLNAPVEIEFMFEIESN
ncbi:MAG: RidA family protein [Phycisphaerales bacterium]